MRGRDGVISFKRGGRGERMKGKGGREEMRGKKEEKTGGGIEILFRGVSKHMYVQCTYICTYMYNVHIQLQMWGERVKV